MTLWSSPRRRRRLLWAAAVLLAVAGFVGVNALLPSHGGRTRASPLETATTPAFSKSDAAEEAAADRSAAAAQPLATEFVNDLASGRRLAQAFALLDPKLRKRYSREDWTSGHDLPLTRVQGTSAGATRAFAGRATAGFVSALQPNVLFAVRFDKLPALGWRVTYVHEGHGSSYVDETNYSPAGFAPGSQPSSRSTWLILLGGFVALVTMVVLVDRRLSR